MDQLILQRIALLLWLSIGLAFAIFTKKRISKIKVKEAIAFAIYVVLGPCGWICLGVIGFFPKQYKKKPELVTSLVFLFSMLVVIPLLLFMLPLLRAQIFQ